MVMAYTRTGDVISAATQLLIGLDDVSSALYALDGEIPNDLALDAVREAREHLSALQGKIAYLVSGAWKPGYEPPQVKCSICLLGPADSGAQHDMAVVTWNDVTVRVCSNCVHVSPVSITDLHAAADRVTPKVEVPFMDAPPF